MNKVKIRLGMDTDIDELMLIENRCFVKYYEAHRFSRAQFSEYIRNSKKTILLVAHSGSAMVGYVAGVFRFPIAHIDSVAVLPPLQKTGIGTKLIKRFLEQATKQNCSRLTLEVAAQNYSGQSFFEKLGFKPFRTIPSYYGAQSDAVRMRLIL